MRDRSVPRGRLAALAGLAGLLLAVALSASPPAHAARRVAVAQLPRLHAVPDPRSGGRIVDADGREVLLRGVNVNALVQYWRGSRLPTVFPLEPGDPRRMAAIGWDAVRLALSWSRLEPRPGRYDERYMAKIASVVARLRRAGIYTILDLHQDAWGPTMAARPGERCGPGQQPSLGWDGAPGWATLDGDAPHCFTAQRELDPAVMAAWTAFFENARGPGGVGIQTRYLRMLAHLSKRFARTTSVAGIDLVNEPNAFGDAEERRLSAFYARAVRAVRAGERAGRGFRHLVLFEPSVLWSAVGRGAPPDFRHDRDVVYAPHIYTGGLSPGPITAASFAITRADAVRYGGAPVLTGEWGADPARAGPDGDGYFLAHQRLQDRFRIGAMLWTWRESCGDPHKIQDLRAGRAARLWGEFDVRCPENRVRGMRTAVVRDLTRGYVRAAPGRLTRTAWNPATGVLSAAGERAGGQRCHEELLAFAPASRRPPRLAGRGLAGRPRAHRALGGGWLITARVRGGRWSLRVARVSS